MKTDSMMRGITIAAGGTLGAGEALALAAAMEAAQRKLARKLRIARRRRVFAAKHAATAGGPGREHPRAVAPVGAFLSSGRDLFDTKPRPAASYRGARRNAARFARQCERWDRLAIAQAVEAEVAR